MLLRVAYTIDTAVKGDLVRRTLPLSPLPRWLDPLWVDADDPTRLPLCWYGVPFVPKLVYAYAERIGLARYYTMQVGRAKAGDLDTFQTWANLEEWFEKESGIKLDLNLVWGEGKKPKNILTFWSNHEIGRIMREMWGQACDLLDDMDYGEEYAMLWYLDHNLDVRRLGSSSVGHFLTITESTRRNSIPLFKCCHVQLSSSLSSLRTMSSVLYHCRDVATHLLPVSYVGASIHAPRRNSCNLADRNELEALCLVPGRWSVLV